MTKEQEQLLSTIAKVQGEMLDLIQIQAKKIHALEMLAAGKAKLETGDSDPRGLGRKMYGKGL